MSEIVSEIVSEIEDGVSVQQDDRQDATQSGCSDPPGLLLRSASQEQTQRLGVALGGLLEAGDVVLLSGELGAGKTTFTQGIGAGLGVTGTINSPTFTLMKAYDGRLPLHHFDLYRIEDPAELFALGFEEYFGAEGVAVVEWAERGEDEAFGAAWPPSWLRVTLRAAGPAAHPATNPDERLIELTAAGARGATLLGAFARTTPAQAARISPPGQSAQAASHLSASHPSSPCRVEGA